MCFFLRKRKARLSGRCARVGRSSRSRSCLVPWRVLLRRGEWSGDNSCVIARVGYQRGCELVYRISTRSFTLHSSFTPSRSGKGAKTKKGEKTRRIKKEPAAICTDFTPFYSWFGICLFEFLSSICLHTHFLEYFYRLAFRT